MLHPTWLHTWGRLFFLWPLRLVDSKMFLRKTDFSNNEAERESHFCLYRAKYDDFREILFHGIAISLIYSHVSRRTLTNSLVCLNMSTRLCWGSEDTGRQWAEMVHQIQLDRETFCRSNCLDLLNPWTDNMTSAFSTWKDAFSPVMVTNNIILGILVHWHDTGCATDYFLLPVLQATT